MGTRHLITVVLDKKIKVAQYGQWDGYLTGVGNAIAKFIAGVSFRKATSALITNLRKAEFISDCYVNNLQKSLNLSDAEFILRYPEYSRKTSSKLLDMMAESSDINFKLINHYGFRKDYLYCEYHYKIDFDKEILFIYKGSSRAFKKIPFSELTPDYFKEEND